MDSFETSLNQILVSTFNNILKFEELSLKNLSGAGVTVSEAHMLEATREAGESVTVSEIASSLGVAVPTATVALQKLERKGLIVKTSCKADGRRALISLTRDGKRIDRAHGIFHQKMVKDLARGFDPSEKEMLLHAINKLNEFFVKRVEA